MNPFDNKTPLFKRDADGHIEGITWSDDYVIRGTISPEEYEVVPTELEKIHGIFEKKWLDKKFVPLGRGRDQPPHYHGRSEWHDYLVKELGLEVISSETSLASPLDYLLERIYSGKFEKVVVRDPCPSTGGFVLMDRDFAQKVLVLGELP